MKNSFPLALIRLLKFTLIASALTAPLPAAGAQQVLSLQDILNSASVRFPKILEAKEKLGQTKASRLSAEGAFDIDLIQQSRLRTSGYYNGAHTNQKLIKPLRHANAKVFAQYRLSDGEFPVYEDEYVTLDGGEISLGVSFSLLRNRDIDPYRLSLANADLDIAMETTRQHAVLNAVLFEAAIAYMEWLSAFEQLRVFEHLFETAKARQALISDRIKLGLSPKIDLLDNRQNLLKHQANMLKAQNELEMRGIALSLYWRDDSGNPQLLEKTLSPTLPSELSRVVTTDTSRLLVKAITLHPEINYVDTLIEKTKNSRQLYENDLLPAVDVFMKASQDLGSGSETREGLESYVGLEFSMPLGQRRARGKKNQAQGKIKELGYFRQRLTESLQAKLLQARAKYANTEVQAAIATQRSNIASELFLQEQKRFSQGASDIFLLNIREEGAGEAQIDKIIAELQHLVAGLELLGEAYQMDKLLKSL